MLAERDRLKSFVLIESSIQGSFDTFVVNIGSIVVLLGESCAA